MGKTSCALTADNATFGDPCPPKGKSLEVQVECDAPPSNPTGTSVCAAAPENATLSLACPNGQTIRSIAFASYGRPTGECGAYTASSCHASTSADVVIKACVGKPNCTIPANNATFGDPCANLGKSLDVQADCAPSTPGSSGSSVCATARENTAATISCPSGQAVSEIEFASYGTPGGTCGAFFAGSCNATASVEVVRNRCVGKASCTISADNATFGDPCSGKGKSLEVQAKCGPISGGGTNPSDAGSPTTPPAPTSTTPPAPTSTTPPSPTDPPPPPPPPSAAFNMGLNLDGLNYYMSYVPFVDMAWTMCSNDDVTCWDPDTGTTQTVDANGYPMKHGQSVTQSPFPAGNYAVTWDGAGAVSFPGSTYTAGATSGSHHTGTLVVGTATRVVVDVTAPVSNLHILAPASEREGNQIYRREFLRRLQPFSTLRFMDVMRTNAGTLSNWSERAWPNDFSHATAKGIVYEDLIQLAIESGKDLWINVQQRATDDFVCRLARLMRYGEPGDRSDAACDPSAPGNPPAGASGVPANRKIYVEYANENWNWAFQSAALLYCMVNGKAAPGHSEGCVATRPYMAGLRSLVGNSSLPWSDNDYERGAQLEALTIRHIGQIFKQVFRDRPGQVQTVLNAQAAWPSAAESALAFADKAFGADKGIDALAIAPYLDMNSADDVDGLTVDGVIASLQREVTTTIPTWLNNNKALATKYGVPVVSYEGGQGLSGNHTEAKRQAQTDPRMYDIYHKFFDAWANVFGKNNLFIHYSYASLYGNYGFWGLFENATDHGTHKWDAVISILRSPGDADLNGVVDQADCSRVKPNLNQTGKWWEDGDFNHDGRVDAKDLSLLNGKLSSGSCQ